MKSIQELFNNCIFRIPDYQRGFSWEAKHLDDLWQDLVNLQDDKFHFTGTITLEVAKAPQYVRWVDDVWAIEGRKCKPYYIVDGQQRLTSIIILIYVLIDMMDDDSEMLYQDKATLQQKYLFIQNEKQKLRSYIFGYEVDNPSDEHLKTKIFKQTSTLSTSQPETIYTYNLTFAEKFFRDNLLGRKPEEREKFFKKVTQQLKFDEKIIEDDLDIFVVFETMNNRGKPLSNLEKLKNRLIYLTSLLPDTEDDEKEKLRRSINLVWKDCYTYLGKNKDKPLSDDNFLRHHFIIYHYFSKDKDFPYANIFKVLYTVNKATKGMIKYADINKYIHSIQKAVVSWYAINNPTRAAKEGLLSKDEAKWLEKINRLQFRIFSPLVLGVFANKEKFKPHERLDFLEKVEAFIFLNYFCSGRRRSLGNPHFVNWAAKVFKGGSQELVNCTQELYNWTYGTEEEGEDGYLYTTDGYFTKANFNNIIRDLFIRSNTDGYYSWSGIKYLLFEYEEYLKEDEPVVKTDWHMPNSIEHVYPQSLNKNGWADVFEGYTPKEKKYLCNSLGNLLLLSMPKNQLLSDKNFAFKRKHTTEGDKEAGYFKGSYSEIDVSQSREWDAPAILKRGKKILKFFNERWGASIKIAEMEKLLLIEDTLIDKVKQ